MSNHAPNLPTKPSDLLELAVNSAFSLDPDLYTPDAMYYHAPIRRDRTCHVCLAGSIMAAPMAIPPDQTTTPYTMNTLVATSHENVNRLLAIDNARAGRWETMFKHLSIYKEDYPNLPDVVHDLAAQSRPHEDRNFLGWTQFQRHADHIRTCIAILRSYDL